MEVVFKVYSQTHLSSFMAHNIIKFDLAFKLSIWMRGTVPHSFPYLCQMIPISHKIELYRNYIVSQYFKAKHMNQYFKA